MAGNKSLGTLTLDLIAKVGGFVQGMDAAERSSTKWRKQVEKDVKTVGNAIGAAAAVAVTGLTAMTVATVKQAGEISKFAALSGTSTQVFQEYAAGAKAVGVEQDKLADIFKDTQDKVGDFLQTGGGPLADFFENIAPKVGVTAEEFRKLSGPEALGLYVSSLEKAGASQNEMTFYLEALASDATLLLPLLKNNAEGFREFGDAAAAAGAIMDEETIRAANELATVALLTDQALAGAKNQIMQGMLPALSDLAAGFMSSAQTGEGFTEVGEIIADTLKFITSAAVGAYTSFQLVGKGVAGLAYIASEIPNGLEAVESAVAMVGDELDATAQKAAAAIDTINSAGESGQTNSNIAKYTDLMEKAKKATTATGVVIDHEAKKSAKTAESAAKALQGRFEEAEKGYLREIALIKATSDTQQEASEAAQLAFELETGKLVGINAEQQKRLEALAKELDQLEQLKKAREEASETQQYTDALREQLELAQSAIDIEVKAIGMGQKRADQLRVINDLQQEYAARLEELAQAQGTKDALSDEAYEARVQALRSAMEQEIAIVEEGERRKDEARGKAINGVNRATEDYIDSAADLAGQFEVAAGNTFQGLEDQIVDFVTTGKADFSDFANSVIADMARIAARQAISGFLNMGGESGGGGAGAGGGGSGSVGWLAGLASMFSGWFDAGGAIPSGGWGIVGEKGPEIVRGPAMVTGRQETAARLDRAISRVEARPSGPTINIDYSGSADRREARQATAEIARGVARVVGSSGRYT